jgi:hypothetical protein
MGHGAAQHIDPNKYRQVGTQSQADTSKQHCSRQQAAGSCSSKNNKNKQQQCSLRPELCYTSPLRHGTVPRNGRCTDAPQCTTVHNHGAFRGIDDSAKQKGGGWHRNVRSGIVEGSKHGMSVLKQASKPMQLPLGTVVDVHEEAATTLARCMDDCLHRGGCESCVIQIG